MAVHAISRRLPWFWLLPLGTIAVVVAAVVTAIVLNSQQAIPSPGDLWAVTAFDAQHVIAVGGTVDDRGGLLVTRSEDAGASWLISHPSAPALVTVAAAGDHLLGATACLQQRTDTGPIEPAPNSCLYTSDDGGATWTDLAAGRLVDPSFANASDGWAHPPVDPGIVAPATLYSTANGGASWQEAARPCGSDTPWIARAVLVGPQHGYVICRGLPNTGSAYPWRLIELGRDGTVDVLLRGSTGDAGSPFGGDDLYGLMMLPDGHGFLLTSTIYRTIDGGRNWTETPTGESRGAFEGGVIVSDSVAYVCLRALGNYTRIYGTIDGGESWSLLGSWPFHWP